MRIQIIIATILIYLLKFLDPLYIQIPQHLFINNLLKLQNQFHIYYYKYQQ